MDAVGRIKLQRAMLSYDEIAAALKAALEAEAKWRKNSGHDSARLHEERGLFAVLSVMAAKWPSMLNLKSSTRQAYWSALVNQCPDPATGEARNLGEETATCLVEAVDNALTNLHEKRGAVRR